MNDDEWMMESFVVWVNEQWNEWIKDGVMNEWLIDGVN